MNTKTTNFLKLAWLAVATSARVLLTAMCSCAGSLYLYDSGIANASSVMVYTGFMGIVILDQFISAATKTWEM